jgi:hypothetical protein
MTAVDESVKTGQPVDVSKEVRVNLTFGAGIKVADLADALLKVPQNAMLGTLSTTYFNSDEDDCDGQDLPDRDHGYFVTTLTVWPDD